MSCVYCDFDGICQICDPDSFIDYGGCIDEHGCCLLQDDEDPSLTCENYESNE